MATINSCNTQLVPIASSNVTYTLQPAATTYGNSQANVTGDGTVYTVLFANEVIDKQGNFSSPTWTAPVTGKYLISTTVFLQQQAGTMTSNKVTIVTTARSYLCTNVNAAIRDANNNWGNAVASSIVDMTSGDTATITVQCSGGTKVVDINGGTGLVTILAVRLVA